MRRKGLYIFLYRDSNGNLYIGNGSQVVCPCSTIEDKVQRFEAKCLAIENGAVQVYWVQKYPYELEKGGEEAVQYILQNCFLVYTAI